MIEATQKDIANIVDLVNIAYRAKDTRGWTSESEIIQGDRINAAQVQQLLTDNAKVFLKFEDACLIGCVSMQIQQNSCYIGMLTTHPQVQNRGVGKKILQFAENFAMQNPAIDTLNLSVLSSRTELIAFYQRRGYQLTGETTAFPIDANVGQPLVKDLVLLYLEKKIQPRCEG